MNTIGVSVRMVAMVAGLVVASCVDLVEDGTGAQSYELTAGDEVVEGEDPAVVVLSGGYGFNVSPYCTGTLISPRTVVTAAHCIWAKGQDAYYSAAVTHSYWYDTERRIAQVVRQVAHPAFQSVGHDIGLLEIDPPFEDVESLQLTSVTLSADYAGAEVRHVGFGKTGNDGGSGVKREMVSTIKEVMDLVLDVSEPGRVHCLGDSGGPALLMGGDGVERIAGIMSYGDANCEKIAVDSRVDLDRDWVAETIVGWDDVGCETLGTCEPAPVEPDAGPGPEVDGTGSAGCVISPAGGQPGTTLLWLLVAVALWRGRFGASGTRPTTVNSQSLRR